VANIQCKYSKVVDKESGDSLLYVILLFQNAKYQTITDVKSIMISTKEDLTEFKNTISEIVKTVESDPKSNVTYSKGTFQVYKYDFSKNIYLAPKDGNGFTNLSTKQATKLIEFLDKVDLESSK
jgi:hypothetical protein